MDPRDLELINQLFEVEGTLKEVNYILSHKATHGFARRLFTQRIHEHAGVFEKKTRIMTSTLDKIHSTPKSEIPALLETIRPAFDNCHEIIATLAETIPHDEVWKWKELWTPPLRAAVFSVVFVRFLIDGTLASLATVADQLGIKEEWEDRFSITPEDYLHGVITFINELSRLAVNAVTLGDFEAPLRISIFAKDVFTGFSMLNLKNDLLRRRFDSLKYDIKKIEEVVYDVSLRKLVPPQRTAEPHE
ncbi:translin [Russula earlei]|uniref:Translin n=1 Tax=Russula earlei TaxID=71964 RepID=A0ACC0ULL3_9AGAM|nr:translin [Russula earlei]